MADKESRIVRLRRKWQWLDHIFRANDSYTEHVGNQYAAAITYFSVLSLVPIMMVAFAVAAAVLAGNTALLDQLRHGITQALPGALGDTVNKVIDTAISARSTVGIVGLVVGLYAGVGWMSNLRDALTAQWGRARGQLPLVRTMLSDLLALVGLGIALVVSFAITIAGSGVGAWLLRQVGLADNNWAQTGLVVVSVVLALLANWLVFLWVMAWLPRQRVRLAGAVRGALLAAIGFEVLKQLATLLLRGATHSPTAAVFGSIIGLLVFANLVSRLLLLATAWTATAPANVTPEPVTPPAPAVIRPIVRPRTGFGPGVAAGLVACGTITGLMVRRRHVR